ncbi:TadE/TadG family type IV pilus assembly protein [Streptomyces sp. NPDC002896]|uniref:TadE/TadG family type IV pilus assembly protein n=1 Tax=Streptomyces sp. NPDC002896 TaxID=3154438 RepID=UPI003333DF76
MVSRTGRARRTGERLRAVRRRERGQVAIEYVGLLPILLIVGLLAVQLGLALYAAQQAGTAARAAARVASHDNTDVDYRTAGRDSVSDWLDVQVELDPVGAFDEVKVTAKVDVPSVIPGVGFGEAKRSVTMPRD